VLWPIYFDFRPELDLRILFRDQQLPGEMIKKYGQSQLYYSRPARYAPPKFVVPIRPD